MNLPLPPHTQHSIIDEPIEHGLAVVASTDTWTSLLMCVSKTGPATADTAVTVPSQYIQQLLKSVKGMWDMRMPSEFVSWCVCVCLCVYKHLSTLAYASCMF